MRRARTASALAALALVLLLSAPAAARPLELGFFDSVFSAGGDSSDTWLGRSADAGAGIVRIDIGWPVPNTPRRPAGFDARNPADPHYDFTRADAAIRDAAAHGLRVLASFTGAPRWAEGARRPKDAMPGTWRPDPRAIEAYGAALARRYSGAFPDPLRPGSALPRVEAFQVWNEPNIPKYLSPQWIGRRPASPGWYRLMLNAFYRGVKSQAPRALVVTAGTGPFGDALPGGRLMPTRFWRELLCVDTDGAHLRGRRCAGAAHFDVLSHHPYSVGSPTRRALNGDDVSIPDLAKLRAVLRAAERGGGALPRIHHRMWVTEVSYDSSPPDPDGIPAARHARFLEQTLYLLWSAGVDTVIWFQIRDQPPDPSYIATNQSGVYTLDGRPKPALAAFRFPLVAARSGDRMRVWGRAPVTGVVALEARRARGWRVVRKLGASAGVPFVTPGVNTKGVTYRARAGRFTSLPWRAG